MLTEHEKEILTAVRAKIRARPGMTEYHAYELETSFDLVTRALDETPEQLATWSHMTLIVDTDLFAQAGYDVSAITKDGIDTLTDQMKDYWVGGKSWDAAIEYAATDMLERVEDEEESEAAE